MRIWDGGEARIVLGRADRSMKTFLKHLAHTFGYDIRKYVIENNWDLQLRRLLEMHNIATVVDVGANAGQYALKLREIGYRGRIISIEPLLAAHTLLQRRSSRDPDWTVAERMALGDETGQKTMNISANLVSSSFLRMKQTHTDAAAESKVIGKESIPVRRLDDIMDNLNILSNVFLKLDVQGFEQKVLSGASTFLTVTEGLQMELSLEELYDGQPLYTELIQFVEGRGFKLFALYPGFMDKRTGRLLQFDGIFFRVAPT